MSWKRLWTVARLELVQRIRTSRWPIALGAWVVVIGLVTFGAWSAVRSSDIASGPSLYDVTTFFVLMLGMLIVPSLTSTTVNGDREHGVLATMQTTLVTSWEIVLGKLLASWLVSMCFLATALPFLAWAWAAGGIGFGRILLSLLVLVVVLAVVAAVGLMFSTLTARPVASAVLTYLSLATLVFGTLIAFLLAAAIMTEEVRVTVRGIPDSYWNAEITPPSEGQPPQLSEADCTTFTRPQTVTHTERIWPLLALNPFVVVADAAPSRISETGTFAGGFTPMRWISDGSRDARRGADEPDQVVDECLQTVAGSEAEFERAQQLKDAADRERRDDHAVWPWGLGFLVALGGGSVLVAERRVRTPVRRLPSGTRIA